MEAGTADEVTARVRGGAVAGATVTLSVAAHGAAGGGWPTGSTALLLSGVAAVLASLAAAAPARRAVAVDAGVLLAGQVLGHLALSVGAHHSVAVAAPMVSAHVVAVLACAGLVAATERLGPAVAAALRAVVAARIAALRPLGPAPWIRVRPAVRPMADILCRSCLPRRGPPVLV